MNSTKYAVRFYTICIKNGQQCLEQTGEVQVHRLINAIVLLSGPAAEIPSLSNPDPTIAKFFIRERGEYREIRPSDWVAEYHNMAKLGESGLP